MYPAPYFLYLVQHSNILLERYIFVWYFMCFSSFDVSAEACSVLYTAVLDSYGLFGPAWEYTGSQSNKSPPPEWWMFCFCLLLVLSFEILFENSWQWFLLSSNFKELLVRREVAPFAWSLTLLQFLVQHLCKVLVQWAYYDPYIRFIVSAPLLTIWYCAKIQSHHSFLHILPGKWVIRAEICLNMCKYTLTVWSFKFPLSVLCLNGSQDTLVSGLTK